MVKLAFIGFGEAGQAFAQGLQVTPGLASAFDTKFDAGAEGAAVHAACGRHNIEVAPSPEAALSDADIAFCLVPTDQAVIAAEAAARHLKPGALWLDGSSSSPGRKREAAALIDGRHGFYVDMAIMAPVHPLLHRTPVLLAGSEAQQTLPRLETLGMNARLAGARVGDASAIKMVRSVLIKGIEAVTAECMLAARRAGVEEAVLASLQRSDPKNDWAARSNYNIERMTRHGKRRAAELREVVATLDELGLPSRMAAATAKWEDQLGDLGLILKNEDLFERLDLVLSRLQ
jgi:3-hydroxyisobutyrate dehydrogenase-like beta-hydroxyacid dehydrogenase